MTRRHALKTPKKCVNNVFESSYSFESQTLEEHQDTRWMNNAIGKHLLRNNFIWWHHDNKFHLHTYERLMNVLATGKKLICVFGSWFIWINYYIVIKTYFGSKFGVFKCVDLWRFALWVEKSD